MTLFPQLQDDVQVSVTPDSEGRDWEDGMGGEEESRDSIPKLTKAKQAGEVAQEAPV
jgi:hypothetical protein